MLQSELKNILKATPLRGGFYFFAGEEDYLKKYYLAEFKKRIIEDESFEAFNYIKNFGAIPDFDTILDALASPPMMAELKLVVWDNIDINLMSAREKERFFTSLENLAPRAREFSDSVLILIAKGDGFDIGTPKYRSADYKKLSKIIPTVEFDLAEERQLLPWIARHFADRGVKISTRAASLIVEMCGRSMTVLALEIDKIASYVLAGGRGEATEEDVSLVASAGGESEAFALTNALLSGDRSAAYDALLDLKRRRVEPIVALGSMIRFYTDMHAVGMLSSEGASLEVIAKSLKMNEYKAKLYLSAATRRGTEKLTAALDELSRMDVASKSGGISGYTSMEIFLSKPMI